MIYCSHLSVSPTKSTEWPVEGLRGGAGQGNSSSTGQVLTCQEQAAEHIGQEQSWRQKAQWQAQERERIMTISQAATHRKSFYPNTNPRWTKKRERNATHTVPYLQRCLHLCICYLQRCLHLPWISQLPYSLCRKKKKKNINLFPQRIIISFAFWFPHSLPPQRHAPAVYHLCFFHLSLSIATFLSPPGF